MQLKVNTKLQSGKYRIIRVLGQGGFGITYLAKNTLLDKMVAIKEFFPKEFCDRDNTRHLTIGTQNNAETVEKLKARFLKEAKNIAKLDHPGIVKIHDVFEENNTAYYVMDYIEGESLSDIVKRDGPMSEAKAIKYIRKVGDALDYIHSRRMTHFDVKPANIMVRKSDDSPVLIDFGLSKQYDKQGDATSTLMQAVSNGFSPIELYNIGSVNTFSPKTDIYSLGATLYYLLTGNIPPAAVDIVEEGLSFPSSISTEISDVIRKAMSVSRSKRPDLSTFIDKLSPTIATEPPQYNGNNNTEDDTIYIDTSTFTASPKPSKPNSNSKNIDTNFIWPLIIILAVIIIACIFDNINVAGDSNNTPTQAVADTAVVEVEEVPVPPIEIDTTVNTSRIALIGYKSALGSGSYTGNIDDHRQPNGHGVLKFHSGDAVSYDGEWVHGNMDGLTTYTLRNGDTFIGYFKNNEYDHGRYTIHESGDYFVGTFKNGQPNKGDWYDKNGNKY